ncbi:hypothetical protein BJV82DRAFT_593707 [Fennellomyces sp. T-0311]|nr:hypothetical protein BJV82DRAFT_593707 [Fennellomyces sp. T-0311]
MTGPYHSELVAYASSLNNTNTPITVGRFIEDKKDFPIQNTPITECLDIAKIWTSRLGKAAKEVEAKLTATKSKANWDPIRQCIIQNFTKDAGHSRGNTQHSVASDTSINSNGVKRSNASSRNTSSTGSKTDSYLLSPDARQRFESEHKGFIQSKKWRLSTGVYVEDVMLNRGLELSYEHPTHSYILCIDDPSWKAKPTSEGSEESVNEGDDIDKKTTFTNEEFSALINQGNPLLPELSQEIQDLINHFRDSGNRCLESYDGDDDKLDDAMLDTLINAANEKGRFDARSQYEEYWVMSVLDQLFGYYATDVMSTVGDNITEQDLVSMY